MQLLCISYDMQSASIHFVNYLTQPNLTQHVVIFLADGQVEYGYRISHSWL